MTNIAASPLVSVLSPSFNQVQWLGDNLASVANQTYSNIEHIVMDGGSNDGSVEILRYADSRVRWRSEPDRGQSHAINKAFAESKGEIIGWLNSDDAYFDTNVVSEVVKFFQRHTSVDVVYGHAVLVNAKGLILHTIWAPPFNRSLFSVSNFIVQPAAFVRRSALGSVMVDETFDYMMDRELWLRLSRGHRFARLNRIIAIDRYYPSRKSASRLDLAEIDAKRLHDIYGEPIGRLAQMGFRLTSVALRLLGVLVLRQTSVQFAFDGKRDSLFRLAFRQVVVKRSKLPLGLPK